MKKTVLIFISIILLLPSCSIGDNSLNDWIGHYKFYEFAEPNMNKFARIEIYKNNEEYFANVNIDGWMTMKRIIAKISGDKNKIDILFEGYDADDVHYEPLVKGDILLSLSKEDSQIITAWGEITPMLKENEKDGVYFQKIE